MTRDGMADPVSRDQILRRERGQEKIDFPFSALHEQDWQLYSATVKVTTMQTSRLNGKKTHTHTAWYLNGCAFLFGVFYDFPWREAAHLICLAA